MKHIGGKLELTRNYSSRQTLIEIVYDGKVLNNQFIVHTDQKIVEIVQRISEIVDETTMMCFIEGEDGRLEMFGPRIRLDDSIGVYSKYFKDKTLVFVHGEKLPSLGQYLSEKLIPNPEDIFVPKKNPDVAIVITYDGHDIVIGKELARMMKASDTQQKRKITIENLRRVLRMFVPRSSAKLYAYVTYISLTVFGEATIDLSNNPLTPVEMGRVRNMFGKENVPYGSLFKLFGVRFASTQIVTQRTIEWKLFEGELMGFDYDDFVRTKPPANISPYVIKRSILIMDKQIRYPDVDPDDEPDMEDIPDQFLPISAITWVRASSTREYAVFLLEFCRDRYAYDIKEVFNYLRSFDIWTQELFGCEPFIITFNRAAGVLWSSVIENFPQTVYQQFVTSPVENPVRHNVETLRNRFNNIVPESATGNNIFEPYLIAVETSYDEVNELFLKALIIPNFMTNISDFDVMAFLGVLDIQAYFLAYRMIDFFLGNGILHPSVLEATSNNARLLEYLTKFSQMFA